uniref:Uncharacterized protein LOC111111306 isoform X2 n=1 Tax=Crassostrea virginica TaxID=6565 RepID=A0A8B8BKP3_CRAVI|nr:uncharacterized protein LOC111111306 isoform X2 [Crassostrea virginica]
MAAYRCVVCDVSFDKLNHLKRHQQTKKHKITHSFSKLSEETYEEQKIVLCPEDAKSSELFFSEEENSDVQDDDVEEIDSAHKDTRSIDEENEWYPFPSKISLLLYGLLHSPTHHISLEVAKYVWFILREAVVPNVPPISQIRQMKFGDLNVDDLIMKGEDDDGLPLYSLKPTEVAKLHFSNPVICKNIARFKEIISPWASVGAKNFHVGDFVQSDDSVGIIQTFLENEEGNVILASYEVLNEKLKEDGHCFLVRTEQFRTTALSLLSPYPTQNLEILDDQESLTENPEQNGLLRTGDQNQDNKAKIAVPVNLFIDDTSTNVSRRWLPMHCAQMQLAGVPLQFRNKEIYSDFLAASENASMLSISRLVLQDIKSSQQNLIETFHAGMKRTVQLQLDLNCVIADFNMLSVTCNHAGATALKFCPKCHADREYC